MGEFDTGEENKKTTETAETAVNPFEGTGLADLHTDGDISKQDGVEAEHADKGEAETEHTDGATAVKKDDVAGEGETATPATLGPVSTSAPEATEAKVDDVQKDAGEAELTEAHPEAQAAVEAAPEPIEELKKAANIAAPALKKLEHFKEALAGLEDEAKARFDFARQKMTEAVAAFENLFKRG